MTCDEIIYKLVRDYQMLLEDPKYIKATIMEQWRLKAVSYDEVYSMLLDELLKEKEVPNGSSV